jgi:hypothetical protein
MKVEGGKRMSEFRKYPDIERLGADENKDILLFDEDRLIVEEKVDGGNGCFWIENEEIHVASRNRDLTEENDSKTFLKQRLTFLDLIEGKQLNPDYLYYIEWMAKHTIHYTKAPDVIGLDIRMKKAITGDSGLFLSREAREEEFKRLGIENVPIVWQGTSKEFRKLNINEFIPESKYRDGKAEGIVIKNYNRKSPEGNYQLYAKLVSQEFKENNKAVFGGVKQGESETAQIMEEFCTEARVRKIVLKHMNEYSMPLSRALMQSVPVAVITDIFKEESRDILKKYDTVDLKKMKVRAAKICLQVIDQMMIERATEGTV